MMEELPQNWQKVELIHICELVNGDRGKNYPSKDKLSKEGLPFVNAGHLNNNRISNESMNFIDERRFSLLNSGKFGVGDILFCIRGSLGKVALNTHIESGAIASSLIIVRPHQFIIQRYVLYYLASPLTHNMINKFDNGTAQPNLSGADLGRFEFPVAPYNEQKRIVAKIEELFSELDKGIENLKTAQEQLRVYRQALLKHAFEGKLTARWHENNPDTIRLKNFISGNEVKDFPELPKGWLYTQLGEVIEEPKYGTSKKCDYDINGIGVLRIPNIVSGVVDSTDLKFANFDADEINTYGLIKGDILTIRSNGSVSIVGKCALVREQDEKFLYAGYLIRLRPNIEFILPEFLINALSSHLLRTQIERKAKSTSGVNNINAGELRSLIIPICGTEEQEEVVKFLKEKLSIIDYLEETIEEELQKSEALRQSILKKAFSGKLVAQDPNDEPASVLLERIRAEKEAQKTESKNPKTKRNAA